MLLLVLFDFISFVILGLRWPTLAWKLSDCSPGKRDGGLNLLRLGMDGNPALPLGKCSNHSDEANKRVWVPSLALA